MGLDLRIHELDFRLALELRFAVPDAHDGGQALTRILAGEVGIRVLEKIVPARVVVDRPGDRRPQTRQVCSTVDGVNGVRKGIDRLGKGVRILQGDVDLHSLDLPADEEDLVVGLSVSVEVAYKRGDPPFEVEVHFAAVTFIEEMDGHPPCDECHLPEALHQTLEAVVHLPLEDLAIELKGGLGAALFLRDLADHLHRLSRDTAFIPLEVKLAFSLDFNLAPFGQRVDRRDSYAMQASRDLVPVSAKLGARMQYRHDDFKRRFLLLGMDLHGDPTTIILDGYTAVGVDRHVNRAAGTRQSFIDRVVDDLINKVVKRLDVGPADIHPRPTPDGFQAFQDLDVGGSVAANPLGFGCLLSHAGVSFYIPTVLDPGRSRFHPSCASGLCRRIHRAGATRAFPGRMRSSPPVRSR